MSVSLRDWAVAGLPLARTFVALSTHPVGATAESVAEESSQDVREVRIHLEQFLLPNGFALCSTDMMYALTQNGEAKLNGDAMDSRNDRAEDTAVAVRLRVSKMGSAAKVRRIKFTSSRGRVATG